MTQLFARLRVAALCAAFASIPWFAKAADAGLRNYSVPANRAQPSIVVALFFPTDATAHSMAMGPLQVNVALGAAPVAVPMKGLILLSHGTGGSELGHASLAQTLARAGYLVAALRQPGDNWQDRSLLGMPEYFSQRPQQLSRVIDALTADAEWSARLTRNARGEFKIGALGHSAGGYTVLALAGAAADIRNIVQHCQAQGADDTVFCNTGRPITADTPLPPADPVRVGDARVQAVVALAPAGAVFGPGSFDAVRVPVQVWVGEQDAWLPPRHHGHLLRDQLPGIDYHVVAGAGHFSFMDRPTQPIPTPAGDAGADLPEFDRTAFLSQLGQEVVRFFEQRL